MSCNECLKHNLCCDAILCSTASDLELQVEACEKTIDKLRRETHAQQRQIERISIKKKELRTLVVQLKKALVRSETTMALVGAARRYSESGDKEAMQADIAKAIERLRALEIEAECR